MRNNLRHRYGKRALAVLLGTSLLLAGSGAAFADTAKDAESGGTAAAETAVVTEKEETPAESGADTPSVEAPQEDPVSTPDPEETPAGEAELPAAEEETGTSEEPSLPDAEAEDTVPADDTEAAPAAEDGSVPEEETGLLPEEEDESEELLAAPKTDSADDKDKDKKKNESKPVVSYQTHVQTYGWQDYVKDGAMAGTSGEAKRLEAIRIKVSGAKDLHVSYRTHVQSYGWQDYVEDGAAAGTSGEAKRLEAIRIRLTGADAKDYDIYYCVHVQSYGWLNWAKNDEVAGTAGYGKRLEGIRIRIVPKGDPAPAAPGQRSAAALFGSVRYRTHVQTIGWQGWAMDGADAGTTGQAKRLEAIRIELVNTSLAGSVQYRTHVQTYGWETGMTRDGGMSGTSGEAKRLEAIEISLTGDIAAEYDIWYRTHVQKYGWTGWAKNGASCGSTGCAYRLEAIQIRLLPKGAPAPGATTGTLYTQKLENLSEHDRTLMRAKEYVAGITTPDMTMEQKLRVCFDNFATKVEKNPWIPHYKGAGWAERYANSYFDIESGNCISYAAAFAYMAAAIGYTNVYAINTGHGWAEIDGLVYDPEWAIHVHDSTYFGIPYNTPVSQAYITGDRIEGTTMRVKIS